MSPATETPAKPDEQQTEVIKRFLTREDILSAANKLKEEETQIEGLGTLLLSEITGSVRADLIAQQATGMMADQKKFDRQSYERTLIQAGVMDPSSPPGGRTTLFRMGDMDRVMKLGASKIETIVTTIERLSSMGESAGVAEGNSATSRNGGGTSA